VFTLLVLFAILVGGVVQIIPTVVISGKVPAQVQAYEAQLASAEGGAVDEALAAQAKWLQQPYSPLELAGRDLYVREGCYTCHSQMIRPLRHEVLRYGEYSRLEESLLDHPFQWGSKRTGPDLARAGGKYANLWHYLHFKDPRSTSPASIMPSYHWLEDGRVDLGEIAHRMQTQRKLGVPYTDADILDAEENARSQGQLIADDLASQSVELAPDSELAAIIAYIQRLGRGPQPLRPANVAEGGR
jgi:cytochrome c oxidase cbb3-type subunit I/II